VDTAIARAAAIRRAVFMGVSFLMGVVQPGEPTGGG
jgi:hypothetical protein